MSLSRPVFNLKAIEFGAFFEFFHLFRHLKVSQRKRSRQTSCCYSHNLIFALFSSVAVQREQRKNQEQGNIYKDLKVIQIFQKHAKTFYFRQAIRQKKKPFEDSPSGFKIRFLRQDPLEAILVIFGRRALIFFLLESSWKK